MSKVNSHIIKKWFLTTVLLLVCLTPARAGSRPVLAVMPFQPLFNVSPDLAAELTGYFITEIAALEYFSMIDRSQVDQLFSPGKDGYCAELSCARSRGMALGADMVVFGTVRREGEVYIINTSLIKTVEGSLVNAETKLSSGSTRGMRVKGAELAALDLVGDLALVPAGAAAPESPSLTPVPPAASDGGRDKPAGRLLYTPRTEPAGPMEIPAGAAPAPSEPTIRVGLKAGMALAGLYGGSSGDWDGRTGFTGGVFLRWLLSESFTVQPELLYTMKGAEYSEDYRGSRLEITLKMDYLELPVLAKYVFPVGWSVKPHVFAGPSVGIKIGDDLKARYQGQSTAIPESVADLSDFEFGLVAGGGFDIPLDSGLINLDIRYCTSVTGAFGSGDEKNSVWAFTAGYVF
ncbi:MAG: outer membrane beta-barrel protein [PVC group bacterium]